MGRSSEEIKNERAGKEGNQVSDNFITPRFLVLLRGLPQMLTYYRNYRQLATNSGHRVTINFVVIKYETSATLVSFLLCG